MRAGYIKADEGPQLHQALKQGWETIGPWARRGPPIIQISPNYAHMTSGVSQMDTQLPMRNQKPSSVLSIAYWFQLHCPSAEPKWFHTLALKGFAPRWAVIRFISYLFFCLTLPVCT